jgi:hypothetical protein
VGVKYRMYIDEVGNSDLDSSHDPRHRYLSLTGIIMELEHVREIVFPGLEQLKRDYFDGHPDDPIVLHRKELLNKKPPFHALRDPQIRDKFDAKLLKLLQDYEYTVITLVIDKLAHKQQYQVWRYDAYHYCLMILLERYVRWLDGHNARSDVLAESRGGKEDRRLKKSFARLHTEGTDYVAADTFHNRLTSGQLKVKPKSSNIAGLQIADLIAHPSFVATRERHEWQEGPPDNFGGKIAAILENSKYYRSPQGIISGWGRKWLP